MTARWKATAMLSTLRSGIAGMTVASFALALGGGADAALAKSVRFDCPGRQEMVIERDGARARVTFADRTYELRRKPSSIGEKYLSAAAALIIDGHSAVFVAHDRFDLGSCTEAAPMISAP